MYLVSLNRVGIVFCGRQSPGGHNVIWGLHNALKIHNPNSTLLGFLGKHKQRHLIQVFHLWIWLSLIYGKSHCIYKFLMNTYCVLVCFIIIPCCVLFKSKWRLHYKMLLSVNRRFWRFICSENTWNYRWHSFNLQKSRYVFLSYDCMMGSLIVTWLWDLTDLLFCYAWQGGYDLLGRTKDQIRTTEQVNAALTACKDLKLDGLVIIGGKFDTLVFTKRYRCNFATITKYGCFFLLKELLQIQMPLSLLKHLPRQNAQQRYFCLSSHLGLITVTNSSCLYS